MRTLIKAKALADGLKVIGKAVPLRAPTLVLGCCRIEVDDDRMMRIAATGLDITHTVELSVLNSEEGVTLVPARQLLDLVAKLAPGAEVSLEQSGDGPCRVSSGRGRWTLPALAPADWPQSDPLDADAAAFVLAQADVKRLVTRLKSAISTEPTRYYLNGIHLHRQAGQLVAVATDGHRLARTVVDVDPGRDLTPIIPTEAVEALAEIARHGDVQVRVDQNKIEMTGAFRSTLARLIDGTYPNYERVIPYLSANSVEFKSADLLAAVGRHVAVGRHIAAARTDTVIGLTWSNGTFAACLAHHEEDAIEGIAAKVTGAGRVAVAGAYLVDALKALAAETVVIDSSDTQTPIRLTAATEPGTLMLVMPMVWPRQAEAAE
jgi:DNA polymerase-3 subunit beta